MLVEIMIASIVIISFTSIFAVVNYFSSKNEKEHIQDVSDDKKKKYKGNKPENVQNSFFTINYYQNNMNLVDSSNKKSKNKNNKQR
jgi:hypothetical protein